MLMIFGTKFYNILSVGFFFFFQNLLNVSAEPAFIGMQVQAISQKVAFAFKSENIKGVLVRDIALNGPANLAGVHRGDVIINFAGNKVDNFETLVRNVKKLNAGDIVDITVSRQGKTFDLRMETVAWDDSWKIDKSKSASISKVGLTVAALTPTIRERFGIRWGSKGVVITLIDPEKAGVENLQRGDVIHQINQKLIWDPNEMVKMYAVAKQEGRKSLLLLIEGKSGFYFSILKVR